MSEIKVVEGSGGGGGGKPQEPTNTPDNLFSEDIVEFALAVSEGPIRGLTNGAKSFYVGDTPLVDFNGNSNIEKFAIGVHPGKAEGEALPVKLKLGGTTSNSAVGVTLTQNSPVTRQTEASLRNLIDEIEIRINIARLMKSTNDGTFNNTASFKIELKAYSASTWNSMNSSPYRLENVPAYRVNVYNSEDSSILDGYAFRYSSDNAPVPEEYWPSNAFAIVECSLPRLFEVANGQIDVTGKTSNGVIKEFRFPVPRINEDWQIRVTKLNPDHSTSEFCDLAWESFQCTTKEYKTYPNVAIVHGLGVASGQFSSIPTFSGVWDGMLFLVPTNYNPDTRTYDEESGPWTGGFKLAWTNNPAWVLYNLIINTRYGLAAHYPYVDCNRFDFYEAAKWCDQLVPSLLNADQLEPRFTYNDVIAEPRDAKEMLAYIAGSFNAVCWDDLSGRIHLKVDRDDTATVVFTLENVTEEGFNYTFTDVTTRINDISVAFVNPDLDWNEDRRRIPDVTTSEAAILRDGRIPFDFIAVGCTNASEAIRRARYRLISAQTETSIVSFTTTRIGETLSLYDVILVADPIMGWAATGRITSHDSNYLYLRDPLFIETLEGEYLNGDWTGYKVTLQTKTGPLTVDIQAEEIGEVYRLKFKQPHSLELPKNTVFSLEHGGTYGFAKPFRITSIEEVDGSPYSFQITAIEINRVKYGNAELNTNVPELTYSFENPQTVPAPKDITITSGADCVEIAPDGTVNYRMQVSWSIPRGSMVERFEASWSSIDSSVWTEVPPSAAQSFYANHVLPGVTYVARVRSIDMLGNRSPWVYSPNYVVMGINKAPDGVTGFLAEGGLFKIDLSWSFIASPRIKSIEIRSHTGPNFELATTLVTLAYPTTRYTHNNLGIGQRVYYWVAIHDREENISDWFGPIHADTSSDAYLLNQMLQGTIDETQLASDLKTRIDLIDGDASVEGSVSARINSAITESFSNIDDVVAQRVDQYTTTVGDHTFTLQTMAESINGLEGEYTVKIDNNGYVAGFGLASEVVNGEPTSSFIVSVDRFAIGTPGVDNSYPFMVGTIGGQTVVGINGTLVVDGTITAPKIDTRGLSIKDAQGNVILSAGTALDWSHVGGTDKPQDGATRNVNRGDWAPNTAYREGDIVQNLGSTWACILNHNSTLSNKPPVDDSTSSTYWTLNAGVGSMYRVEIESTNGWVFRPGQTFTTILIAHVFKNDVEVTDQISADRFRWRRVSYYPDDAPISDSVWNMNYTAGYKSILISIADVTERATFHCDIVD